MSFETFADKDRVSNWVPTGSHSRCPNGHLDVWVAYFVYKNSDVGWEFSCHECGLTGKAEMKQKPERASDGCTVNYDTNEIERLDNLPPTL